MPATQMNAPTTTQHQPSSLEPTLKSPSKNWTREKKKFSLFPKQKRKKRK